MEYDKAVEIAIEYLEADLKIKKEQLIEAKRKVNALEATISALKKEGAHRQSDSNVLFPGSVSDGPSS